MHKLLEHQLAQVFPDGLPSEIDSLQPLVEQGDQLLESLQKQLEQSQQQEREKQQSLELLIDVVADACIWIDENNKLQDLRIGKPLARIYSDKLKGEPIQALNFGDAQHLFDSTLARVRRQQYSCRRELLVKPRNKELFLEARFFPLDKQHVMVTLKDITIDQLVKELNNTALEESKRANKQLQDLMNSAPVGILITDDTHRLVMINDYAKDRLGKRLEELIGQDPIGFVNMEQRDSYMGHVKEQSQEANPAPGKMDLILQPDKGEPFVAEMAFNTMVLEGKTMVTQVFTDISERKALEQQLRDQAHTDPLTGTNNRRFFSESAETTLAQAKECNQPFSILAMDLDNFKKINDKYGHASGDKVLSQFVNSVTSQLRPMDILGRFGGEEFMLALPDTDTNQAAAIAERIRKIAAETDIDTEQGALHITVSIGVASLTPRHQLLEQILNEADNMLYRAKDNGRDCVVVQRSLPRKRGT